MQHLSTAKDGTNMLGLDSKKQAKWAQGIYHKADQSHIKSSSMSEA